MQFIQSGQGLDVSIPPGQSIAISSIKGTYSATLLDGAGNGDLALASTGGATYGPYQSGATVHVAAGVGSCVSYDIGVSPSTSSNPPARFVTDLAGNVTGLIAPNGDTVPIGVVQGLIGGDSTQAVALDNAAAINSALADPNFRVVVPGNLGALYIAQTVEVPSDRDLIVGKGTYLTRVPDGDSYHLVRNAGAQNSLYVNGLTISGGSLTLAEPGHSRAVGDVVYLEGFTGNATLNGQQTITESTPGVSWSFAASGADPTNTGVQCVFASRYNALPGASLTRASNVVTVQEPGHGRGVGDHVYIGRTGLTSTNQFGGAAEVVSVNPGVSWTYANTGANETPTGTTHLSGDRNIHATLLLDGNGANVTVSQATAHASEWVNCSASSVTVPDARGVVFGRVVASFNVSDFEVPFCHSSYNCAVGVQFDSFCDRVTVGTITGYYNDDCLAWGVTSAAGAFGDTTAPTGPGNMGTLVADSVLGNSPTGQLKMYAYTGYNLGTVEVRTIAGKGPVTIGDGTAGVGGGTFDELKIGLLKGAPVVNGNALSLGGVGAWSVMGRVNIGEFVDNPATAGDTGFGVAVMSPFDKISVGTLACRVNRTVSHVVSFQASGKVWKTDNLQGKADGAQSVYNLSSGTVTDLFVGSGTHEGASANNGFLVYANGGFATNIHYMGLDVPQAGNLFYNASSAGATWNIFAVNLKTNDMASGFGGNAAGTYNLFLTNCVDSNVGNNYVQFGNSGQTIRVVVSGGGLTPGKNVLLGTAETLSINGAAIAGDFGANGANLAAYLAGAQSGDEVTNTNATGPGVYVYKGSSSSWALRTAL